MILFFKKYCNWYDEIHIIILFEDIIIRLIMFWWKNILIEEYFDQLKNIICPEYLDVLF